MTLEEHRERCTSMIEVLRLSAENKKIAQEYLLEETADDSVLKGVQPKDFFACSNEEKGALVRWMELLRQDKNQESISRWIKFLWAAGKSSAIYVLEDKNERKITIRERQLRIDAVGTAAVAAMEAEKFAHVNYPNTKNTEWLHELAQTQPQTLELAQTLGGTSNSLMDVMLAGILLCSAPYDEERVRRQCAVVVEENISSFRHTAPKLTGEERDTCIDYIKEGNPCEPVPMLSDGKTNAFDARSAMRLKSTNEHHTALFGTASFFAQQYDPHARCAVRMYAKLNPLALVEGIMEAAPHNYLMEQFDVLCSDVPGKETMLLIGMGNTLLQGKAEEFRKIAQRCKSSISYAIHLAEDARHDKAAEFLVQVSGMEELYSKEAITLWFLKDVRSGEQEMRDLLEGEGSLKFIEPKRLKNINYNYQSMNQIIKLMSRYYAKYGWDNFLCRSIVVLALSDNYCYYMSCKVLGWMPGDGSECTAAFVRGALAEEMQLETVFLILSSMYESIYNNGTMKELRTSVYNALSDIQYLPLLCRSCQKSTVLGRSISIEVLEHMMANGASEQDCKMAKDALLGCAADSSVQLQGELQELFVRHPEWVAEYESILLKNKKYAARLLMVKVLASFRDGSHEVLREALKQEKNVKVADAIRETLGESAEPEEEPADLEELAARVVAASGTRKLQWLLKNPLPLLRFADDAHTQASETRRNAILLSYSERKEIGISETAAKLSADLDKEDLRQLAHEVYELWMEDSAPSKNKWVLSFAAIYGGASMTPKLRHAINEWPQNARGAIACDAVRALVLSSDPSALLVVDSIAGKFKFRQVKQAAADALKDAASQLGITPQELADRIVPDLGFSQRGTRVFDYGPRSFTVTLTPQMTLQIENDAGKIVKSMPAPGKTDDEQKAASAYGEFKELKKQIRTTVASQKTRLEAALSELRCWDTAAWGKLFVENPIMHQFAISLIWGIYEDTTLKETFRYMEDGSFNTVDEEEYTLPENARIGLVHPVDLSDEALAAWKQQLEDYEITQSIQQLDRPIYRLNEAPEQGHMDRFGGRMLPTVSLFGKLQKFGWYRGSICDGGGYFDFYREDKSIGLGVQLNFSGSSVGYADDDIMTVYDAVFYHAGTVERGSYCYDAPSKERIVPLGKVPPRYYSEIVYQLEIATASSTETNPKWEEEYRRYK